MLFEGTEQVSGELWQLLVQDWKGIPPGSPVCCRGNNTWPTGTQGHQVQVVGVPGRALRL